MDISDWRKKIDAIDGQLLELLNERAKCVVAIGKIKKTTDREIRDPAREAAVINRLTEKSGGPYSSEQITSIYSSIIAASRILQQNMED
jgi:chorismate mutase-like protein